MAISRYKFTNNITDDKGITSQGVLPAIKAEDIISDDDIIMRVKETDRLDKLAFDYLGDGRLWWVLCLINDLKLPFDIMPGMLIRIPKDVSKIFNIISLRASE